jgi:hypothetical protein
VLDSDAGGDGGAIALVNGTLHPTLNISNTEMAGNTAGGDGGALYYDSVTPLASCVPCVVAEVSQSTLSGNSAGAKGGGVYIEGGAPTTLSAMRLRNDTLTGNSATAGGGGLSIGAGPGEADIYFATIANNTTPAAGAGGGIATDDVSRYVYLAGTILGSNTAAGAASNCSGPGTITDLGYNLESANSCQLNPAGPAFSLINTDPLLAPLAANGGPTRTHGLYNESLAVNRIPRTPSDTWCQLTQNVDQRGVARPAAPTGLCDVGAFEGTVGPAPQSPVITPPGTTPAPPPFTPVPKKKCKKKKKKHAAAAKKCRKRK